MPRANDGLAQLRPQVLAVVEGGLASISRGNVPRTSLEKQRDSTITERPSDFGHSMARKIGRDQQVLSTEAFRVCGVIEGHGDRGTILSLEAKHTNFVVHRASCVLIEDGTPPSPRPLAVDPNLYRLDARKQPCRGQPRMGRLHNLHDLVHQVGDVIFVSVAKSAKGNRRRAVVGVAGVEEESIRINTCRREHALPHSLDNVEVE